MADYTTVPAGTYLVRIREVRPGETRNGHPRWALALEVIEGEHKGRLAAWDAIVWSPRGRHRALRVMRALGIEDPESIPEPQPWQVHGRVAFAEIRPVESLIPTGDTIRRNEIPYDGWGTV